MGVRKTMKMCQMIAHEALKNKLTHYHGAIEANIEFLDNYKGKKGTFIKKYLIGEEFNMNRWRTTWEAIKKDVWDFVGRPLVLTPKLEHPRVYEQEDYRVGEIIDVGLNETARTAWQVSHITDKKTVKMIKEKKIKFGSPTVLPYSDSTTDIVKLGDGRLETTLHRFIPAHDCLVGNPAYGKEVDNIPAVCDGDGPACALKLLEVSASYAGDINDDNTTQLTIVPFVKKAINKHFKSETISEIVGYIQNADESKLDSCVERKIKILADEHPKWDQDQIVAVAFSYCREKSGDLEKSLLGSLAPDILSIRNKAKAEKKLAQEIKHLRRKLYPITV